MLQKSKNSGYIPLISLMAVILLMCSAVVVLCITPREAASAQPTDSPAPDLTLTVTPTATDTPSAVPTTEPTALPTTEPTPQTPEGEAIVTLGNGIYTYDTMINDLADLAIRYKAHFTWESCGQSEDGREMAVAYLGNRQAKKQVLITAGMHAREYVNCYCVMRQLEAYLEVYDTESYNGVPYRELFDRVLFVILPMTNPDGNALAQEGLASIRNETLRNNIQTICDRLRGTDSVDTYLHANWKSNARGVDINRNFNALWNSFSESSGGPGPRNYKGDAAESEAETRALAALTDSLSCPAASICVHMQGKVIYWRCFQTGETEAANRRLMELTQSITSYSVDDTDQIEPSYSNWTIVRLHIPTITIENGISAYPLSYTLADSILENNMPLWAAYAYEYQ